jgi:hypothetical protein
MKKLFILLFPLLFLSACVKPLMNNSKPIIDLQNGLVENTKNLNEVAKKVDILGDLQKKIAVNLGLETTEYDKQRSVSKETALLFDQIKADREEAKKDREANAEILKTIIAGLKVVGPIAGTAIGIPPAVTQAGLSMTDAILGAGGTGVAISLAKDFLATRRKKKEDEEWQAHCEELEAEALKEKEEMKKSLLIKMKTSAKMPPEHMALYDEKKLEAIAELKAEGKI